MIILLTLWKLGNDTWQALWIERWGILIFFMLGMLCKELRWKRLIYPLGVAYLAGIGLVTALTPGWVPPVPIYGQNILIPLDPSTTGLLQDASLDGVLCLAAFLIFLTLKYTLDFSLKCAGVVIALGVYYQWLKTGTQGTQVPFLSNPSMTATFIALTLFDAKIFYRLLGLGAVLLTGRHTPLLVFVVSSAWLLELVPLLVVGLIPGVYWVLSNGIPDNGRMQIWAWVWEFFTHQAPRHILFGLGLGTGRTWPTLLQIAHGLDPNKVPTWIWFHNDFLQILFETGVIGLSLFLLASFFLFKDLDKKGRALLLGYLTAMLANFPLHWALPALVAWNVAKHGVLKKDEI